MKAYKYDMHVHTMETSQCGHMFAEDILDYYCKEGYSGIAVTDHFHEDYFSKLPEYESDWKACVRRYLKGYHTAAAHAQVLGMDVLLGIEIRFPESQSDYLVFGIDEDFLYNNPYINPYPEIKKNIPTAKLPIHPNGVNNFSFIVKDKWSKIIINAHIPLNDCVLSNDK
jgi:predicted metal-dependent phosphoesterase TrpH